MTKRKKSYGTSGGIEITDELIEKVVAEAEAGIDISRLRPRRGRPPMGDEAASVFQVRLEPELRKELDTRAKRERTTPSELVRRILRKEFGPN
jgi:hypothetical protein